MDPVLSLLDERLTSPVTSDIIANAISLLNVVICFWYLSAIREIKILVIHNRLCIFRLLLSCSIRTLLLSEISCQSSIRLDTLLLLLSLLFNGILYSIRHLSLVSLALSLHLSLHASSLGLEGCSLIRSIHSLALELVFSAMHTIDKFVLACIDRLLTFEQVLRLHVYVLWVYHDC